MIGTRLYGWNRNQNRCSSPVISELDCLLNYLVWLQPEPDCYFKNQVPVNWKLWFQFWFLITLLWLYPIHRYPFDTQSCTIQLAVQELDLETVRLIPKEIIMNEKLQLTMYIITKWHLVYRNLTHPQSGIEMVLVLKRRITNELLTTYLPTILLILITYATTFFRSFYFEAAVTVNLTTMLVMTTIFISIMSKLPSTAYIKMIDIWLIMGQLTPFSEVILLTVMELLRGTEKINHHGSERMVQVLSDNVGNLWCINFLEEWGKS